MERIILLANLLTYSMVFGLMVSYVMMEIGSLEMGAQTVK